MVNRAWSSSVRWLRGLTVPSWCAAGFIIAHGVLAWMARPPGHLPTVGDAARYTALARSLREFTFRDIYAPDAPFHILYPPGYPAFVAGLTSIFGESLELLAMTSVLFACGALLLTFLAVRRIWSPWGGVAVVGLLAFNPFLVEVDARSVSEPLYMLLSMAALYAVLRTERPGIPTACACAAALVRGVGLTLVAGVGLHWLLKRRYRATAILAIAAGVTVVPWYVWTVVAPVPRYIGSSYSADFLEVDSRREGPRDAPPPPPRSIVTRVVSRAVTNTTGYLTAELPRTMGTPRVRNTPIDNVLFGALLLLGLSAGLVVAWARWRAAALYGAAYAALLLIWPWMAGRFLVPLLPVLTTYLALAFVPLRKRAPARLAAVAAAGTVAMLLIGSARRVVQHEARWSDCRRDERLPTAPECVGARVASFMQIARYARDSLPLGGNFLTSQPHLVYVLTRHGAVTREEAVRQEPAEFGEYLRRRDVRYVILSTVHPMDEGRIPDRLRQACREMSVLRSAPPYAYLLRVEDADGGEAACAAIEAQQAVISSEELFP